MICLVLFILLRLRVTRGALSRCDLLSSPEVYAQSHVERTSRCRGTVMQTVWCSLVVVEQVVHANVEVERPVLIGYDRLLRVETP